MGPPGDGTSDGWIIVDEKLYINLNSEILNSFTKDTEGNIELGNQMWTEYWGGLQAGPFYPTCFSQQGGRCDDPGMDADPGEAPDAIDDPPEDPDPEKQDGYKDEPGLKDEIDEDAPDPNEIEDPIDPDAEPIFATEPSFRPDDEIVTDGDKPGVKGRRLRQRL